MFIYAKDLICSTLLSTWSHSRLSTTNSVMTDWAAGVVGRAGGSDSEVSRSITTCIFLFETVGSKVTSSCRFSSKKPKCVIFWGEKKKNFGGLPSQNPLQYLFTPVVVQWIRNKYCLWWEHFVVIWLFSSTCVFRGP